MFDNISKYLIEQYPADFTTWLLGMPIELTTLHPTELSLEPIRADSLILLQAPDLIFHTEFQTDPDPSMPFRMLDYRVRGQRKFPEKRMIQVVIYLRPTESDYVYQNSFEIENLSFQFQVIRIWEIPSETFFQSPGLLPYATLGQTFDREQTLQRVAQAIEDLPNSAQKRNLAAATSILSGLRLDKSVIQRLLRSSAMRESVIYQDILQEGERIGEQIGRQEEGKMMVLRQLTRKLGNISPEIQARIGALPLPLIEELSEDLLDFGQIGDLNNWFKSKKN